MLFKDCEYIKQCEIGDKFYRITKNKVMPIQITQVRYQDLGHYSYIDDLSNCYFGRHFGTTLFKTEEDAYKEILKRQNIKEKRELLKEYERELNMRFNLEDHYIIK